MLRFVLLACLAFSFLGCKTNLTQDGRIENAKNNCEKYGYKKGSKEFTKCVESEARAIEANMNQGIRNLAIYNAYRNSYSAPRSTNCTTSFWGRTANTNCY